MLANKEQQISDAVSQSSDLRTSSQGRPRSGGSIKAACLAAVRFTLGASRTLVCRGRYPSSTESALQPSSLSIWTISMGDFKHLRSLVKCSMNTAPWCIITRSIDLNEQCSTNRIECLTSIVLTPLMRRTCTTNLLWLSVQSGKRGIEFVSTFNSSPAAALLVALQEPRPPAAVGDS